MTPCHWVLKDGLGTTFEGHVRDSKTGPGRHVACVGQSRGELALDAEAIVREYWRASGIHVEAETKNGMKYEVPDYYVIRVAATHEVLAGEVG